MASATVVRRTASREISWAGAVPPLPACTPPFGTTAGATSADVSTVDGELALTLTSRVVGVCVRA